MPSAQAVPRVIVYGGLGELLPHFDVTPAIEKFLYGPNDYGKALLRNPQGLTHWGSMLLVCDQGQPGVIRIDLASGRRLPWGDRRHQPACPVDITTDRDGRVFVADTTRRAVLVYDATGAFQEQLTPTADPGRVFRPCAVLADGGVLYVGDAGGHRVERWSCAERRWLEPLAPPGPPGTMVAPTGLAMTAQGLLLVVDSVRGRVLRRTSEGRWLEPIGRPGRMAGEFVRPKQACATRSGLVLVSDAGRQSVLVFRGDGSFMSEIHEQPGWRGLTLPDGLLSVRPEELPQLGQYLAARNWPPAGEYVIVSDTLGGTPLTLLGIVDRPAEVSDAR